MPIQRNPTNLGEVWVPTPISELESYKYQNLNQADRRV